MTTDELKARVVGRTIVDVELFEASQWDDMTISMMILDDGTKIAFSVTHEGGVWVELDPESLLIRKTPNMGKPWPGIPAPDPGSFVPKCPVCSHTLTHYANGAVCCEACNARKREAEQSTDPPR